MLLPYERNLQPSLVDADLIVPVAGLDETGAANRVTPAVTKAAAAEIQSGQVISMAHDLVDGVPLFGTRFTKTILTSFAVVPGAEYGKNKLSYMEDTYLSQSHVGTHIDGMGHIGIQDCYYNQVSMGKYVTQNYLKTLGLEKIETFATSGVIIDLVKVLQQAGKLKTNPACQTPCLDGGTVITEADIQAGLKMYNVSLRDGDAVFLHTGWGDLFKQFPARNADYNKGVIGAAAWFALGIAYFAAYARKRLVLAPEEAAAIRHREDEQA